MTATSQTIAVGFDGSAAARAALDWAATEAQRTGANLRIISVAHHPGMTRRALESAPMWPPSMLSRAHELTIEASLRARNILDAAKVETQIAIGATAEALVTATKHVQLLVVGNRGRCELASTVLGSVSFAVAAHGHCPIIVVREGAAVLGSDHPVVVGVDGSLAGDRALDAAADIAAHAGAPLRIISAWEMWAEDTWASASWESELPVADWARTQQNAAVRVVTKAADRARWQRAGLAVTAEVHKGPAGVALTSAHDAGLVVVGSRGLGGFSGLVLGSVSHNVIHSCDRPVMVVPASTREPPPDRSGEIPDGLTLKEEANR